MFPSSDNAFSPSSLFSAYASLTGFLMLFRSMLHDFVPEQLRTYFSTLLDRFFTPKSKTLTVIIDENFGSNRNQVFDAAELYLRSKIGPETERLRVGKTPKQKHFTISIEKGEEIIDSFEESEVKWSYVQSEKEKGEQVKRHYELTFEKKLREKITSSYLTHVVAESEEIKRSLRVVKLYSKDLYVTEDDDGCAGGNWGCISLEHPSTFETLAMDPNAKKKIIDDLDRFLKRRDKNNNNGRVTLSGILNFIDGLWSSFGDERIIVFTTNHKERLDPALLRPGRMDMHINMSYCTGLGFRTLVSNYLGLDGLNHPLCEEIERLVDSTEVTPAELAEELMQDDDCDVVLRGVVSFVEKRKVERSKAKESVSICNDDDDDDAEKQSVCTNGMRNRKKQAGRRKRRGARNVNARTYLQVGM
ncbi:BnaA06g25360D [Brassica napus]|uniref:BnaA06g25360D protein n=1 Tax=Brassica napus TaxID=3708 RepID=A0A078GUK0_BRANA|nr:BnaA06g25360D [Brassica napus]